MNSQYEQYLRNRSSAKPQKMEDKEEVKKDVKLTNTIQTNFQTSLAAIKAWQQEKSTPENTFWGK